LEAVFTDFVARRHGSRLTYSTARDTLNLNHFSTDLYELPDFKRDLPSSSFVRIENRGDSPASRVRVSAPGRGQVVEPATLFTTVRPADGGRYILEVDRIPQGTIVLVKVALNDPRATTAGPILVDDDYGEATAVPWPGGRVRREAERARLAGYDADSGELALVTAPISVILTHLTMCVWAYQPKLLWTLIGRKRRRTRRRS
jgi:hypothetical protein